MSRESSIVNEITELMKNREMSVKRTRNIIRGTHPELPVTLVVRLNQSRRQAIIELEASNELPDVFIDLIESNEDVEDIVDTVLGEIRDTAVEISRILEREGFKVSMKITEGEKEVRSMFEEVAEEYVEFEEEE